MKKFAKTFYCPDLVSQEDAMVIQQTLMNAPGIEEMEVDHAAHTVYIASTNQEGLADLAERLHDAGYGPEDREEAAGEVGSGTVQSEAPTS